MPEILLWFWLFFLLLPPGLRLLDWSHVHDISPVHRWLYAASLSAGLWIALFTLLRFVPLPLDAVTAVTAGLTVGLGLLRRPKFPRPVFADTVPVALLLLTFLLFLPLYRELPTPSGGDMATHSYIARLILERNTFPDSYEPLIPIRHFGSYSTGMPVLMALLSRFTGLPVHRTGLILTVGTYIWFAAMLYLFLSVRYPRSLSAAVAVLSALGSRAMLYYLPWGGNPFVLATALLLAALALLSLSIQAPPLRPGRNGALIGLLLFASFTTHHIPFIAASYLLVPLSIWYRLIRREPAVSWLLPGGAALTLGLFSLSFLVSLKTPSPATLALIRDWQQGNHGHVWRGTLATLIPTLPRYLADRLDSWLAVLGSGALLSLLVRQQHRPLWMPAALAGIVIGIVNSHYWILPLSPLLYPERLASLAVIPLAAGITHALTLLARLIPKRLPPHVSHSLIAVCILIPSLPLITFRYRTALTASMAEAAVTPDDLQAIAWISRNLPADAVIGNNYGDAGLWIPALGYRTVTYNDVNPYDFDELFAGQARLRPTHVYIGAKVVYRNGDQVRYTHQQLSADPRARVLARFGNAAVYEVDPSGQ